MTQVSNSRYLERLILLRRVISERLVASPCTILPVVFHSFVGSSGHRPCILHSTLGYKPSWGLKNSGASYKGNVFCCKIKEKGDN